MFQSTRPRGRTRHRLKFGCCVYCLFQSTRPRGRTRLFFRLISAEHLSFNPRVLAGGRDTLPFSGDNWDSVSIHASSREDATSGDITPKWARSFNPRVLAGGRDNYSPEQPQCHQFQSTRPRGRTRRNSTPGPFCGQGFNPRVLAGGRDHIVAFRARFEGSFNPRVLAGGRDGECRKQYKSKCYICKSAKEIILIINEEQYHFS